MSDVGLLAIYAAATLGGVVIVCGLMLTVAYVTLRWLESKEQR